MDNKFHEGNDFFNHPYYSLSKKLGETTGLWPYPSKRRSTCLAILLSISVFQISSQVLAAIHYRNYSDVILALIPPFIIDVICMTKLFNGLYHSPKMRKLFEWMKEDWRIINNEERKILHEYADFGKFVGLIYSGVTYATVTMFVFEPLISYNVGKLFDSNYTISTVQGLYPVPMYFGGLNFEKFYYLTLALTCFDCIAIITITISSDAVFIVFIQHVCGRFAGLGYKIENLPLPIKNSRNGQFEYVCKCIVAHNRILKFADTLKSIYVWCFLSVIGSNMIILSITAVQAITQANTIWALLKFAMFTSIQIVHLFFECYLSQRVVDHSTYIQTCIGSASWYNQPQKIQKLWLCMLMRSQITCQFTAGKILKMSMETFAMILKTSASYFTVILSMQ